MTESEALLIDPTGNFNLIPLSNGGFTMVDKEDIGAANKYKWYRNCNGYAISTRTRPQSTFLHGLIMQPPDGVVVDHKSGNKLDNRRSNLRLATHSQNLCNRGPQKNNTSGLKGVSWVAPRGKWLAQICFRGVHKNLGRYPTKELAAAAYAKAAEQMHGTFAGTRS